MGLLDDFSEEEIETTPEEKKPVIEEKIPTGLRVEAESKHESVTTGQGHQYKLKVINDTGEDQVVEVLAKLVYDVEESKRVNWKVNIVGETVLSKDDDVFKKDIEIEKGDFEIFNVEVNAPDGARYGEKL